MAELPWHVGGETAENDRGKTLSRMSLSRIILKLEEVIEENRYMARLLPSDHLPMQKLHNYLPTAVTFIIVLTAVLAVFSVVTFLCGSHNHREEKKRVIRLGGKKKPVIKKMKSSLSSSKAVLMAKMISWRKVQDEGQAADQEFDDDDDEDGAVWKKTIIKGEKCRPLEFSGRILYDSDGNLLPD
ncbi:hypothetical protein BUALT_Bualt04G0088900 [Buddleja alternifolia]|uniref:Uncharacterized protein n=1 Tax=Buddleja alternifolia TaxID=168488 RepID=A0AAV6XMF4_9LAMI|nr:hypothetical protein BUALT_Bualt04G0088900 [Buddleja alternifolia]